MLSIKAKIKSCENCSLSPNFKYPCKHYACKLCFSFNKICPKCFCFICRKNSDVFNEKCQFHSFCKDCKKNWNNVCFGCNCQYCEQTPNDRYDCGHLVCSSCKTMGKNCILCTNGCFNCGSLSKNIRFFDCGLDLFCENCFGKYGLSTDDCVVCNNKQLCLSCDNIIEKQDFINYNGCPVCKDKLNKRENYQKIVNSENVSIKGICKCSDNNIRAIPNSFSKNINDICNVCNENSLYLIKKACGHFECSTCLINTSPKKPCSKCLNIFKCPFHEKNYFLTGLNFYTDRCCKISICRHCRLESSNNR